MIDWFAIFVVVFCLILLLFMLVNRRPIKRKVVGALLVAIGIDFITPPWPSVDFPLFLFFIFLAGLSPEAYMVYVVLTVLLGVGIAFIGMKVGGITIGRIRRKLFGRKKRRRR